ncbi:MAG: HNH endonuclease [Myxococcales bacterium]|nr:HNH endonuclease [Myxococcales bacterium]
MTNADLSQRLQQLAHSAGGGDAYDTTRRTRSVGSSSKERCWSMRSHGTTKDGTKFDETTIAWVFLRSDPIDGLDPNEWRRDLCGATIRRSEHGNTESKHGWEIDHVQPVAFGGGDELENLQPLQWENNRAKGNGLLRCAVRS